MFEPSRQTQQTYDEIADEFARVNSAVDARLVAEVDAFATRVRQQGFVVDVGCGPGREINLLRTHGLRVVGLDLSLGQLRLAGVGGLAQADMRYLPLRSGVADGIWCQAALLHIPRAETPDVFAEFARVLRPGGAIYLSVAEGDGEGWEIASNYGSDRRRWFTNHRDDTFAALLTDAGFVVTSSRTEHVYRNWLRVHAYRAG